VNADPDEFNFLLYRKPSEGLLFVALDSVVGYIRKLSGEMSIEDDNVVHSIISDSFDKLADILEGIEDADSYEI